MVGPIRSVETECSRADHLSVRGSKIILLKPLPFFQYVNPAVAKSSASLGICAPHAINVFQYFNHIRRLEIQHLPTNYLRNDHQHQANADYLRPYPQHHRQVSRGKIPPPDVQLARGGFNRICDPAEMNHYGKIREAVSSNSSTSSASSLRTACPSRLRHGDWQPVLRAKIFRSQRFTCAVGLSVGPIGHKENKPASKSPFCSAELGVTCDQIFIHQVGVMPLRGRTGTHWKMWRYKFGQLRSEVGKSTRSACKAINTRKAVSRAIGIALRSAVMAHASFPSLPVSEFSGHGHPRHRLEKNWETFAYVQITRLFRRRRRQFNGASRCNLVTCCARRYFNLRHLKRLVKA